VCARQAEHHAVFASGLGGRRDAPIVRATPGATRYCSALQRVRLGLRNVVVTRSLGQRAAGFVATALLTICGLLVATAKPVGAVATPTARMVVNGFATPSGHGFWLVSANGGVMTCGDAQNDGGASALPLNRPIVGGAVSALGGGYWLVGYDGGIFSYGAARFYGSMGARRLRQAVFSMAATTSGHGYWLVARDGGIFSFGDARFHGSTGNLQLNQPIEGITTSPTGRGYRMVARDGGIFSFGDAPFYGSLPGLGLHVSDVIGMAPTPTNKGYWIARSNGAVYAFGDALNLGEFVPAPGDAVTAVFSTTRAQGYRLVTRSGRTIPFGDAPGGTQQTDPPRPCATSKGVCGNLGPVPQRYASVVVFAFENRTWNDVGLGFGRSMPYLHGLGKQCSYFSDWTEADTSQSSLTQYVGQVTGAFQGGTINDCSPSQSCSSTADNIFRQARRAGLTAADYVEGATTGCSAPPREIRIVSPFYLWGADDLAHCNEQVRPYGELDPNALPAFAFVIPTLCHSGHDCADSVVDAWAHQHIQPILDSAAYRAGNVAVFIWYDEDHPVPNLWLTPTARPGAIATPGAGYTGTLRAWESMLGLPCLANACTAPDMRTPANS